MIGADTTTVSRLRRPRLVDFSHLLSRPRSGPWDALSKAEILAKLPDLPDWKVIAEAPRGDSAAVRAVKAQRHRQKGWMTGAGKILLWLSTHPGDGWQARWVAAGADRDLSWIDTIDPFDARSARVQRWDYTGALSCLFLHRVILPSYDVINEFKSGSLLGRVRAIMRPDLFVRIEQVAVGRGLTTQLTQGALAVVSKVVLHTGRDIDELGSDDLLELFAWCMTTRGHVVPGLHLAWDLLTDLGGTAAGSTLRGALLRGPKSTEELVDGYGIQCRPIRDVLVRYLEQRRPGLDYSSLVSLTANLAGLFWADLETHHPGIDSLHLSTQVEQAWKQRIQTYTRSGQTKTRQDRLSVLTAVRSFYLDVGQWALEDPSWVPWAVPSPISRHDTRGLSKANKRRRATMHQRIRERLPHLPLLADTAARSRDQTAAFLAAAQAHQPGDIFEHANGRFQRVRPRNNTTLAGRPERDTSLLVKDLSSGRLTNISQREDEAFWAWALIETLRHTGVRVEELLEITHLALVSYRLPDTDELVPLLQIVPSKSNEERLLLISPELASVLASVITRLRDRHGGSVPLVTRYDEHERITGPPLPHLFQRTRGGRPNVINPTMVKRLINGVLASTSLTDAAGQPLVYTPHDFRRMFATEAVSGGLPVHIAARLLGHASLETTQAYLAVFQGDLIRSYRAFLAKRRSSRPAEEYRTPTDDEWREFQQHFQTRKLELGTCGRPYGSPCQHEHACIRCPMLRVDPRQRDRLSQIVRNLSDRIAEARMNGWHGEVLGLQVSLDAAARKLAQLPAHPSHSSATQLGMPVIRSVPTT